MFNKKPFNTFLKALFLALLIFIYNCKEEEKKLTFSEEEIASNDMAEISMLIPMANASTDAAVKINKAIKHHIVNEISFTEEAPIDVTLEEAIDKFDKAYYEFKEGFPSSEQQWNASVEGEVLYQSPEIITIAMNSYLDTGGAHGNDNITFLNFDPKTGDVLKNEAVLEMNDEFIKLAETYFRKEVTSEELPMEDYFFGDAFHLPANIGFSEEGVVFLYNVYEIASYSQGYTEFIIPFDDLEGFLKVK